MKNKRVTSMIVLASVSLLAGTALAGCGKAASSNAFLDKKLPVETQMVKMSDIGGGQVFSGQITPETLTNVASKLNGKVTNVMVHVGDHVTAGQSLATIDTSQLQQQLQQSQSTVAVDQAQVNQAQNNQQNSLANAKSSVEADQAQLAKAQLDHANSIISAQQSVDTAKIQFDKAQTDQANSIAQAQQAVAVAQAAVEQAKANHAAALASANASVGSAQSSYDNSKQGTDNNIKQLQLAADQAKTAYNDALQQFSVGVTQGTYAQYQANIDAAYTKYLQAQLQLSQAEAQNTVTDSSLQAPLQAAQVALQNAQNSKDVDVALANYNQSVVKLTQLQGDASSVKLSQQQLAQANQNLQVAQNSTSGIAVAKAQLDQANQSVAAAQSGDGVAVAQAQLQAAETNVNVINEQLQDGVLKSPVDGVVTAINAPVGQMAGGTGSVVSIASTSPTIATVNVPEATIGKVKIGTDMLVNIPTLNQSMQGKVLHIHPMMDSVTKSYGVDIQVNDPKQQLLPGMFVEASLKSEGRQAIMVPADAILSEANGNAAFIIDHGKAKKVLVQIGEMTSTEYEIKSGLHVGDQVVVKGEELLSDGAPVDIVKPGANGSSGKSNTAGGNK
ncbi:efflux RND transporter periplasmic adaptor subunit [Fodinisporobacter ferrooxydans]|uniref:Efflux RND transporter periplasmic adaptor subunit n=1 Tax=Fodinisporobacter ferrooxydans TaxID=2901836 RepID=A0ABY4CUD8_9BACL|nr:efflux RND transporter periplasmic adaptor subunit [Alicyclobacillaceae bacterium MYW30-H2]